MLIYEGVVKTSKNPTDWEYSNCYVHSKKKRGEPDSSNKTPKKGDLSVKQKQRDEDNGSGKLKYRGYNDIGGG